MSEIREIGADEVAQHGKEKDCWVIIKGRVYDVTKFVEEHPGGDVILDGAGIDATELFEDIGHSDDARQKMKTFQIGVLKK